MLIFGCFGAFFGSQEEIGRETMGCPPPRARPRAKPRAKPRARPSSRQGFVRGPNARSILVQSPCTRLVHAHSHKGSSCKAAVQGTSSCTDRIHANSLHMDVVRGSSSCKALVKGTVEPRARHCVSSWSQGPNVRRWCEVLVQGSGARRWCKAHPRAWVSWKGFVQVLVQGMATGLLVQGPRARLEVLIGSL